MDRPTGWKARPRPAIVAAVAALIAALALAPASFAAEAATDEYVLEIPGARQSQSSSTIDTATGGGYGGEQLGVAGEANPPQSGLDSLISALAALPTALLVAIAILIGLVLAGRLPARTPARETR